MWLKTTKMKKYKKNAQYGGIAQIESDFANKTCGKSASKISCTNEVVSWSLCAGSFFFSFVLFCQFFLECHRCCCCCFIQTVHFSSSRPLKYAFDGQYAPPMVSQSNTHTNGHRTMAIISKTSTVRPSMYYF